MTTSTTGSTVRDVPEVQPWTYPYAQIAEHYRGQIKDGRLSPGDKLPTVASIAKEWDVAIVTVQRAIAQLRKERLVETFHGRGSFVVEPPAADP
jgi:DNA-binding GntR family transcriptional regulator